MAISFIPDQTGQEFVIGGQSSIGPFPKYSVNRESVPTGDGTNLCNKYTITINGQFIVDSDVDIATSGARQSNYNQKIIQRLSALRQYYSNYGRLEISPYGGQPNKLIWNDAKLLGVDVPESSDESSSMLFGDFVFTFEAYTEVSILGSSDGNFSTSIDGFDYDKFFVSSVDESWDLSIDEDCSYPGGDILSGPNRTYTVTHTLSATGLRKPLPAGGFDTSAWREAQKWVKSRLVDSPSILQTKNVMGGEDFTDFAAKWFGNTATEMSTDISTYSFFNHMRVPSIDIANGSYSVTETWKASDSSASTIDINIDMDIDQNQMVNVTANGSIQGLDKQSLNTLSIQKLANAEATADLLFPMMYDICNNYYTKLNTGFELNTTIQSRSIGRNPGSGVITFSYSFNDHQVLIDDAVNTNLSISYDNKDYEVQIVAIIMIIAKQDGPVIQDMNTSRERKKSVQLDAIIKRDKRDTDPKKEWSDVAISYRPSISPNYIQNFAETWDPINGNYSVSVEWVY